MSTPTTRKYPRTLQEAFPSDSRHAFAIERTRARMGFMEAVIAWASIVGLSVMIAYAIAG